MAESVKEQKLVELTLRSGKSYIGFALNSGITIYGRPDGGSDIVLIPVKSGYRDTNTRRLEITTDYISIIQQLNQQGLANKEDFRVVIPMSEIISARIFYNEVYERFQQSASQSTQNLTTVKGNHDQ